MPDRPYTDADLRTEAARQHAYLTEDPDYTSVGEGMQDSLVESADDGTRSRQTWYELLVPPTPNDQYEAYETAQRKVHDLIRSAAEISEWAVSLGADELEPHTGQVTVNGDNRPIVRVHFAFAPDMPTEARADFITGIGDAINDLL